MSCVGERSLGTTETRSENRLASHARCAQGWLAGISLHRRRGTAATDRELQADVGGGMATALATARRPMKPHSSTCAAGFFLKTTNCRFGDGIHRRWGHSQVNPPTWGIYSHAIPVLT